MQAIGLQPLRLTLASFPEQISKESIPQLPRRSLHTDAFSAAYCATSSLSQKNSRSCSRARSATNCSSAIRLLPAQLVIEMNDRKNNPELSPQLQQQPQKRDRINAAGNGHANAVSSPQQFMAPNVADKLLRQRDARKHGTTADWVVPLVSRIEPTIAGRYTTDKRMAMQFDETASGSAVVIPAGEEFDLSLPETQTAGYRWTLKNSGEPTCRLLRESFQPAREKQAEPAHTPGSFELAYLATCSLTLEYGRSWESNAEPARTFGMTVRVQP